MVSVSTPYQGGPLYRLCTHLAPEQPSPKQARYLAIAIVTFTWFPMLVLSLDDGFAVAGVKVPFFYDLEAQARFLIAIPLLIMAAPLAHRVLSPALRQFLDARIVSDADTAKFKAIAASTALERIGHGGSGPVCVGFHRGKPCLGGRNRFSDVDLVCGRDRVWATADASRLLVCLGSPPGFPIYLVALVFSAASLGELPLAGVTP
jgi:hypothetical protein